MPQCYSVRIRPHKKGEAFGVKPSGRETDNCLLQPSFLHVRLICHRFGWGQFMSQGFSIGQCNYGFNQGDDMNIYTVVAKNIHHGLIWVAVQEVIG